MLKRLLIGKPLKTSHIVHEKLSKTKALAVFSSDALSSVAYATDEITIALAAAGATALSFQLPIALSISILLFILTISYRQTIHAYPSGGGSYIVAKDNLGEYPGLIAGSSLLIDYILTVAVSISSGVLQLTSAFPFLSNHRVIIAIGFIILITIANLRGVRESGTLFAVPTYIFIFSLFTLIIFGLIKFVATGAHVITPAVTAQATGFEAVSIFLILRAFSSGCSALTGVEAISNGVPAFKAPESKNARTTLLWMSMILFVLFIGVTLLSKFYGAVGNPQESVISQIGDKIYGRVGFLGILYYITQISTSMILILAANTSYADFPRLSSLIAKDGYLPRMLASLGDRLVYSNGIIILGVVASLLIIFFKGDTHLLIPLYAVGVFISFTLSQTGMVRHWLKVKEPGYKRSMIINGLGAIVTAVTAIIIAYEKFSHGAWIVILLIPVFVLFFKLINDHYTELADELRFNDIPELKYVKPVIIMPVAGLNKMIINTLEFAKSLSDNIVVVHISLDNERAKKLKEKWETWNTGIEFNILPSPYRSIIHPLMEFIDDMETKIGPKQKIMVLIPEFITRKWWHAFLHNQTGILLNAALLWRKNVIVTSVPYHLQQ